MGRNRKRNWRRAMGNESSQAQESLSGTLPYAPVPSRYRIFRESGDGNCLYLALSRQLGRPHGDLRDAAADWIEVCFATSGGGILPAHFAELTRANPRLTEASFRERYLRGVRGNAWGSGIEAMAISYCFSRPLWIWQNTVEEFPDVIHPPDASQPCGLLHVGGNHWNSVVLETIEQGVRSLAERPLLDSHHEDLATTWHGGNWRSAEDREALRRAVLARAEKNQPPQPKKRSAGLAAAVLSAASSSEQCSAPACNQLARCAQQLQSRGMSAQEAEQAIAACEFSVEDVTELYSLRSRDDDWQACVTALMRVGMTEVEAVQAVEEAGSTGRVRDLYCIDWDSTRTIQNPFR
mmetsp:Transcript_48538/g.128365  ORF Transcript_48538/g.128365 Transcript_48538/m.128365 type:complete len:351 (-) Transcript_48538:75-1127(-)